MLKRTLLTSMVLGVMFTSPVLANDLATQLVGVWKLTDVVQKEAGRTNVVNKPFGDKPSGMIHFTKGGHFVWSTFGDQRKPLANPATDSDRSALLDSMFVGVGTYTVENNSAVLTYSNTSNEVWRGTTRKPQEVKVEGSGKILHWISQTFPLPDGRVVVAVSTFEKVE